MTKNIDTGELDEINTLIRGNKYEIDQLERANKIFKSAKFMVINKLLDSNIPFNPKMVRELWKDENIESIKNKLSVFYNINIEDAKLQFGTHIKYLIGVYKGVNITIGFPSSVDFEYMEGARYEIGIIKEHTTEIYKASRSVDEVLMNIDEVIKEA